MDPQPPPDAGRDQTTARSRAGPSRTTAGPPDATCAYAPAELAGLTEYERYEELGRGGMGVVYKARNTLLGREEVLKVMGPEVVARPGAAERFLQEIQAAARLDHPNIVRAYSARQVGDGLVFAMEYVPGTDLRKLVAARGPLPVAHACYYARQVADGLQHAHARGMVHRDIKPANLVLAREGKRHLVKVLDFGLAKVTSEAGPAPGLTGDGGMLGTPDFIAPEQIVDASRADTRADVYALGCTLYFLLTGAPPFRAAGVFEVLRRHREESPPPLRQARPDVPEGLAAVVEKMMAKAPADRFQTPGEVSKALAAYLRPGAGTPSEADAPAPRPRRRVPWWAWPAAAAAGLAVAVALWAVRPKPPRAEEPTPDAPPAVADSGFVPLFNGRDLGGWLVRGMPASKAAAWAVEDGAIVGRSPAIEQRSYLVSAWEYSDFVLRFEYRVGPGGAGGVTLRAADGEKLPNGTTLRPDHPFLKLTDPGAFPDFPTGSGFWVRNGRVNDRPPAPLTLAAGAWHRAEVTVRGDHCTAAFEGRPVVDVRLDPDPDAHHGIAPGLKRTKGRVGFQIREGTFAVRGVEVRPLGPSGPAAWAVPYVVATWEIRLGTGPPVRHRFYSNGRVDAPDGAATWAISGTMLTLRWPTAAAPGGAWVDSCALSADGRSYTAKNQGGAVSSGRKIADGEAPPKK